jgi:hypothetical protein
MRRKRAEQGPRIIDVSAGLHDPVSRFCDGLRFGLTGYEAARYAGVDAGQVMQWLAAGALARGVVQAPEGTASGRPQIGP